MKFRKLPVEINAIQWKGDNYSDIDKMLELSNNTRSISYSNQVDYLEISTLEGVIRANKGDYIICGVNGELYPCKPDIFNKTYEVV